MSFIGKVRWLFLLGFLAGCSSLACSQDVVLITNPAARVSEISAADVRAIFLGAKTRFSDGSRVAPVILKGGPAHEVFLKNHLGQSPDEFRAQWRKVVFTGQGTMPKTFDSESALIEYIASTPGTIGYVSRVSAADNVKTLIATK